MIKHTALLLTALLLCTSCITMTIDKPADTSRKAGLRSRLENTIVPEIDLKAAAVRDVVTFLYKASGEYDPSGEGTKVNLILNLSPEEEAKLPKITFSAQNMSLYDVLQTLSRLAPIFFDIESHAVFIEARP